MKEEIAAVTKACHDKGAIVKVIFETDYISDAAHIAKLCEICTEVGADFVKTSTGFGYNKTKDGDYNYIGATEEDITTMKNSIGPNVKIKASGGIRTLDKLLKMKNLGCHRCGATATVDIMEAAKKRFGMSEMTEN